jgi:hypothetical protein
VSVQLVILPTPSPQSGSTVALVVELVFGHRTMQQSATEKAVELALRGTSIGVGQLNSQLSYPVELDLSLLKTI